jgi:hypothetical protein
VAVLVLAEVLQPERGLALMPYFRIDEADLPGLVMEFEALESLPLVLLESAVDETGSIIRYQAGFPILDEEERVLDRDSFRLVAVICEDTTAVADRKDTGDQLQVEAIAGLPNFTEAAKIIGRFLPERIETGGQHGAIDAMCRGLSQDVGDLGDIAVLAEIPSEDPD